MLIDIRVLYDHKVSAQIWCHETNLLAAKTLKICKFCGYCASLFVETRVVFRY